MTDLSSTVILHILPYVQQNIDYDLIHISAIFIVLPLNFQIFIVVGLLVQWYIDVRAHLDDDYRIPLRCEYGMRHIADELAYWHERRKGNTYI